MFRSIYFVAVIAMISATAVFAEELPMGDFIRKSEFTAANLSPDGTRVAVVMNADSRDKLALLDVETLKPLQTFEFGEYRRLQSLTWADANRTVIASVAKTVGYLDTKARWERMVRVRVDEDEVRTLFNLNYGTYASLVDPMPYDPEHILVSTYNLAGSVSLKKYHLDSGRTDTQMRPGEDDIFAIIPDRNGNSRMAVAMDRDENWSFYYRPDPDEPNWETGKIESKYERFRLLPMGFSKNPDLVYLLSNHDASTFGLFSFNLRSGELKKLYRNDDVDIDGGITSSNDDLLGVTIEPGYGQQVWVQPDHPEAKLHKAMQATFPERDVAIEIAAQNENRKALIRVWSDRQPLQYYLYDPKAGTLRYLFGSRPWVEADQMAEMQPKFFKARDGLEIPVYLTLPKEGGSNLPLVLNIHGGPHGPRDSWGYDSEVQLLANRGYAVLQVNYRGSGGYGRDFEESGYLEWGGKMQDDVTDATHWAIEQGIADPDRICIYGGSYGGYATLMGVVKEPDLYKCAIGYVGVYDLREMKKCGDIPKRKSGRDYLDRVLGEDEAELIKNSPAQHVERIKAALFIAHGEDDVRVPMCQAEVLKENLDKAGKDYIWMTRDEGHGYHDPKNRKDFYGTMLEFLSEHIGPDSQK